MWIVGIVVILGWIASVCVHEFGHAVVAYLGGDTSVKDKGYLSLNPAKYMDPQMSLVLPVVFLLLGGIALPGAAVYVNESALRNRFWRSAVSAAGPIGTALSVLLLVVLFQVGASGQWMVGTEQPSLLEEIWAALAFLIFLNIYMVFLNSLPIPPLDGFGVLRPWLSPSLQARSQKLGKYGILILFGLLWFVQPFNQFLIRLTMGIADGLGVPQQAIAAGAGSFRATSAPIFVVAIIGAIAYQKLFKPKHKSSYDKGMQDIKKGNYAAALAQFEAATQQAPDFYDGYLSKALVLSQMERDEAAIAACQQAIAIDPTRTQPYEIQASLLAQANRRQEASKCYACLAELEPETLSHQASAAFFGSRYDEALTLYDRILVAEPNNATVWCNKACCYSHLNDLENVVLHLTRAIELDSTSQSIIQVDPDLARFRTHPKVQALLSK